MDPDTRAPGPIFVNEALLGYDRADNVGLGLHKMEQTEPRDSRREEEGGP